MAVASKVSLDLADYTHEKLIARGYTRYTVDKEYPGWVVYEAPNYKMPRVGIAGNDATMGNWIEQVSVWKKTYPTIYKWWMDPAQKIIFHAPTNDVIIKSEDPMLVEADGLHA